MSAQPVEAEEVEAEVEAVEVEAVEDDDPEITEEDAAEEADDETAPELEPAAEAPLSEKEIDKLTQALEREAQRHTKRIGEIMGDDAVALVMCEACDDKIPGWHWPAEVFPEGSPERTLYELLAGGTDAQMKHHDRFTVCASCNGFGQVLTGARNEIGRMRICPECGGDGYKDAQENQPAPTATPLPLAVVENFTPAQAPEPEKDFLGRPVGHPNYGKMSTYLTASEQALDVRDGFGI